MGLHGSVGAHIKTGRSPMAQDHFKTPPGPKRVLKSATVSQHLQGWLRKQRMVRDTTDGEGHNGWLRIQQVVKDTTGG